MNTKKCSRCGRTLPVSEFNKNKNSNDGLQDKCRACFSEYNKNRYARDRERFKRDVHNYRLGNPMQIFESRMKTWSSRDTHSKIEARRLLEAAVRAGVVTRPTRCQGCGCSNTKHRIEAHHYDYENPLDVIWLCTPCHSRMDQQRRKEENSTAEDAS